MSRSKDAISCDETDCSGRVTRECACSRCRREPDANERFHVCIEHMVEVDASHRRIRGRPAEFVQVTKERAARVAPDVTTHMKLVAGREQWVARVGGLGISGEGLSEFEAIRDLAVHLTERCLDQTARAARLEASLERAKAHALKIVGDS